MPDDLDELDASLRRAMAALDGEAPAGYFDALPGRTLARLDDPAIGELPEAPGRPLRAVSGRQPSTDEEDEEDDAVLVSQVMAAVELPEDVELAEPAQPGARPRRDRASASSAIMRAVPVDADGELRDPGETRGLGSNVRVRSASSIIALPIAPVEPGPPAAAAVDVRAPGAAAAMTVAGRGRRRRVHAAIVAIGGIGLAAAAAMYLRAGDRAPRSTAWSGPSSGESAAPQSERAAASPGAGSTSIGAGSAAVASGPGSGSAAITAGAAAGSGAAPGLPSGTVSAPGGKIAPPIKRPGGDRPPSRSGVEKPAAQLAPRGKGAESDQPEVPVKKLKSIKPRPDRTSLSGDAIERAMTSVAGQVRACVAGTGGTPSLRLTVAPSGRIARVTATGPLAGTPQGACVERAVQAATFPAWSGGPQSFDYSYPLSD